MPAEMEPLRSLEGAHILDKPAPEAAPKAESPFDPVKIKALYEKVKKECFEGRWVFERQWLRAIYYILDRQWIRWNTKAGEWQDKRLAKWVPRPTNPDIKNGVQAIRSMFASIKIGVNVRPTGNAPENIAVAAACDELHPILHEDHKMNNVLLEADWWDIVTGNAFLYSYVDYDEQYGTIDIPQEQCLECGEVASSVDIHAAGQQCPSCGGTAFEPAVDPETGEPIVVSQPKGKPVTRAISPLELAFPNTYARFSDVPYFILMRWRSRSYYEQHAEYKNQVIGFKWQKSPQERSMQIFKMLPSMNDLGMSPFQWGGTSNLEEEGAPEFEMHVKPCGDYPKGLVVRMLGDGNDALMLENTAEGLPGPFPYADVEGKPICTIHHYGFEHVGGRVLYSGACEPVMNKLDQLNQHDSMIQMGQQRMANPIWLKPKGSETTQLTGETGLVVEWNPLTSNGAEPKRLDGIGPPAGSFNLRDQYKRDIEEGMGSYDVLKGNKPSGVDSFSGMQLMVERSQSRFSTAFQSRGDAYRAWYQTALELEREFGPDERTSAILSPSRQWTFKNFKRANLQGSVTVMVEDGSMTPKTSLGIRASVEHLNTLQAINMQDPDQRYKVLQLFGQTQLAPSLDIHMQAALRKQQAFEEWLEDPMAQQASMGVLQGKITEYQGNLQKIELPPEPPAPEAPGAAVSGDPTTGKMSMKPQAAPQAPPPAPLPQLPPPPSPNLGNPLEWMPWYDAAIHKQEFVKWANSDKIVQLLKEKPAVKELLLAHLMDIDNAAMMQQMQAMGPQPSKPGGAGLAMKNSNQESGSVSNASGGGGVPAQAA
jgi:hypothetical protein